MLLEILGNKVIGMHYDGTDILLLLTDSTAVKATAVPATRHTHLVGTGGEPT